MDFYLANGRDRETHRWGFVCYRLTYNQTDVEWADFMTELEADMHNPLSGAWAGGFESIADMAGLNIHDGRELGIAEGDVEAAKKHFKKTYTMLPTLGRMLYEESPGYRVEMKVLSSLVFTEIYPLLATSALRPTSLWPLARLHPREVYVGHTTESQESWWEFGRSGTTAMMGAFFADLKKKRL